MFPGHLEFFQCIHISRHTKETRVRINVLFRTDHHGRNKEEAHRDDKHFDKKSREQKLNDNGNGNSRKHRKNRKELDSRQHPSEFNKLNDTGCQIECGNQVVYEKQRPSGIYTVFVKKEHFMRKQIEYQNKRFEFKRNRHKHPVGRVFNGLMPVAGKIDYENHVIRESCAVEKQIERMKDIFFNGKTCAGTIEGYGKRIKNGCQKRNNKKPQKVIVLTALQHFSRYTRYD